MVEIIPAKLVWELVDRDNNIERAKIPGGWLVKIVYEVCHIGDIEMQRDLK